MEICITCPGVITGPTLGRSALTSLAARADTREFIHEGARWSWTNPALLVHGRTTSRLEKTLDQTQEL